MDINKSLTFFLEDERRWEKLLMGTVVVLISLVLAPLLIGVAGFMILTGYSLRLLRNVRDGAARPLPEWDRWGDDLAAGFKYALVMLVYALPLFVLWIPLGAGAALTDSSRSAGVIGIPLLVLGACLVMLYSLFYTLATPAITIRFARDEQFGSAFDFGAIWAWTRAQIGPVIVVTLVYLAASFVLGIAGALVGVLLCVVGLIVTLPLATLLTSLVQFHLYGQLARSAGEPVGTAAAFPAPALPGTPAAYAAPDASTLQAPVMPFAPADLPPAPVQPVAPFAPPAPLAPPAPDASADSALDAHDPAI